MCFLAKYDTPASRYVALIRDKKRAVLEARMTTEAYGLYLSQLDNLSNAAQADFKRQTKVRFLVSTHHPPQLSRLLVVVGCRLWLFGTG